MLILHSSRKQLLVWDPVTGDQHRLDIPPGFDRKTSISGAVLRASSGDVQHFQVVLTVADNDNKQQRQAVASLYSSETGAWSDLISTPLPSEDPIDVPTSVSIAKPAVMAGGSLYWKLHGDFVGLLEFYMEKQCLAVIEVPVQVTDGPGNHYTWDIFADGGGLSFLYMSTFNLHAHLSKRETDCDGTTSWVLGRTIDLVKLLSLKLNTWTAGGRLRFLKTLGFTRGFAEENNVVLLWTINNVFTVQLETLQFKKLSKSNSRYHYYPFEGVYTAETGIGGGHYGAELLHNAEDDLSG